MNTTFEKLKKLGIPHGIAFSYEYLPGFRDPWGEGELIFFTSFSYEEDVIPLGFYRNPETYPKFLMIKEFSIRERRNFSAVKALGWYRLVQCNQYGKIYEQAEVSFVKIYNDQYFTMVNQVAKEKPSMEQQRAKEMIEFLKEAAHRNPQGFEKLILFID